MQPVDRPCCKCRVPVMDFPRCRESGRIWDAVRCDRREGGIVEVWVDVAVGIHEEYWARTANGGATVVTRLRRGSSFSVEVGILDYCAGLQKMPPR